MPKWLKCRVEKGMFSDEVTVIIRTLSGETVSFFVPRGAAEESSGRVKVRVTERGGQAFALLPDEHQSVIDVAASELVPA